MAMGYALYIFYFVCSLKNEIINLNTHKRNCGLISMFVSVKHIGIADTCRSRIVTIKKIPNDPTWCGCVELRIANYAAITWPTY